MLDRKKVNSACESALEQISEGNISALSVIYEHLGRMILSVACSVLTDPTEAEDVLQDTLCQVVASCTRYEKNTNPRAWILGIARNLALTRAKQRTRTLPLDETVMSRDDTPSTDLRIDLEKALLRLEDHEREVVILRLETGLSHREIARITGLSVSCVQKRYRRALARLRCYLSPKGGAK